MFVFHVDLAFAELFQFTHGTPFWDTFLGHLFGTPCTLFNISDTLSFVTKTTIGFHLDVMRKLAVFTLENWRGF